jgi:hypothetical protein
MPTDTARNSVRAQGAFRFRRLARPAVVLAAGLALHGCYPYPYYPPGAVSTPAVPASFENSWQAARGAAYDEGVNISFEDRASGVLRGTRGPFDVTINVTPQADGSVRVSISATGPTAQDPGLQERLTRAYNRRMGR